MVDVTFIIPPSQGKVAERIFGCNYSYGFTQHNWFVLSALSQVKARGHTVELIDCIKEKKGLNDIRSDVILFWSVFLSRDLDIAVGKRFGDKIRIYMGSDPSFDPDPYLYDEKCLVIRGEPEHVLPVVLDEAGYNFKTTKSVSWRKGNDLKHNTTAGIINDLDDLVSVDRRLYRKMLDYNNPKFANLPSTTILGSRGCSHRCYFCVPNSLSYAREQEYRRWTGKKPPVRLRRAKSIIDEFEEIHKLGFGSVLCLDDIFLWGKKRVIEIFDTISSLGLDIGLLARPDNILDEDLTRSLAVGGVKYVNLGVESFNQEILNDIKKDIRTDTIVVGIRNLRKHGIRPEINLLFGASPLETEYTMWDSFLKTRNLARDSILHLALCTPFPGTDFYEIAKQKGWINTGDYVPVDPSTRTIISYPHISSKKMQSILRKMWAWHYLSYSFIKGQVKEIKTLKNFLCKVSGFKGILERFI